MQEAGPTFCGRSENSGYVLQIQLHRISLSAVCTYALLNTSLYLANGIYAEICSSKIKIDQVS